VSSGQKDVERASLTASSHSRIFCDGAFQKASSLALGPWGWNDGCGDCRLRKRADIGTKKVSHSKRLHTIFRPTFKPRDGCMQPPDSNRLTTKPHCWATTDQRTMTDKATSSKTDMFSDMAAFAFNVFTAIDSSRVTDCVETSCAQVDKRSLHSLPPLQCHLFEYLYQSPSLRAHHLCPILPLINLRSAIRDNCGSEPCR